MFDFITRLIEQAGYLGVALLMFLENVFPPIPSELIMPLAGFTAARGDLNIAGVIAAGTTGTVAGALPWYYVGRLVGDDRLKRWAGRHGRWLTLKPAEVDRVDAWFEKHCGKAVFFGHLVPTIRTLVSVPAGIFEMSLGRFLLFTAMGGGLWTAALALAGYLLEDGYDRVAEYMNPATNIVVGLIAVTYLYRVATFRREARG
jgi:membrane protein DedA with SNARE-associated domain